MRARGITYDTGMRRGNRSSRERFETEVVRRELAVIADELHCSAVRITGGDLERLTVAGRAAADAGLEVWWSPFPTDVTTDELRPLFADAAERAEELREAGAEVVLVTGCELSLFAAGFIPGGDADARLAALTSGDPALWASMSEVPARMNAFLAETASRARERFGGRVTYAAGMWEQIDWSPFDLVGVDAYRSAENAGVYGEALRASFAHGKPVAVTEFGCCTYHGAGDRGGAGWAIVDRSADPPRLAGDFVRDEDEQVRYLRELLEVFEQEGVDTAFWFTFAGYELPHRADPRLDLDMASFGVVKVVEDGRPDLGWEPKASFPALAEAYARGSRGR